MDSLRSSWCGLGRDDLQCPKGSWGPEGGREGLRPRPDYKLDLGALEHEGKLEGKRKTKMRAFHQAEGDVAHASLMALEVLVWPSEALLAWPC